MADPTPREIANDPEWIPHTYDLGGANLTLVHVPREARGDLMFLSDEHLGERFPRVSVPAAAIAAELSPATTTPLHFIFHTSFCCSTLLARALTVPGVSEALKEPDVLINLANRLARSDDAANRQRLELVLRLLERTPAPDETVIVKPTNFANRLVEPALSARPEARAVLLYSDVETFLRSLLKRGMMGRRFGRQLYLQLANWAPVNFGLGPAELFELTDVQVAGLAWLMQIAHFDAVARASGPERVMILDAADFTAETAKTLHDLQAFFGLGLDSDEVERIATGPVFSKHSKFGDVDYGRDQRQRDHEDVDRAHGEELRMVVEWVQAVAARLGLPLQPRL